MKMTPGKSSVLIVMLVASTYYGYSKYKSVTPSAAINNGVGDEGMRIRNGGERGDRAPDESRRQQLAKTLNLTPEQEARIKAIRESGLEGRDRMTSMAAVLTPQQRAQMQAQMDGRRDRGAKATLSAGDFEKYKAKRDEMRKDGRGPRMMMMPRTGGGERGRNS